MNIPNGVRFSTVWMIVLFAATSGQVPRQMNYQGYLTDAAGKPVDARAATLTFRFYDSETGGNLLATHVQTNVVVDSGYFNTVIGSDKPMDLDFTKQYWISMQLNDAGEILPRMRLTSSAYSLNSARTEDISKITAGGDLSGTYPNPQVNKLQGTSISISVTPSNGQVLKWNGTAWMAGQDETGLTGTTVNVTPRIQGDGSNASPLDIHPQGATKGQVLKWDGEKWTPKDDSVADNAAGPAGGDLSGNYPNPQVNKLQGTAVAISGTPGNGQVLKWDGEKWTPKDDSVDNNAAGPAGGDLGGSYPNPQVNKLQGTAVAISGTPSSGQVLKWDGENWKPANDSAVGNAGGDLNGIYPNLNVTANAITSAKILDGTIQAVDLVSSGITSDKLADGSIISSKISSSAVDIDKIANNAVNAKKIVDEPGIAYKEMETKKMANSNLNQKIDSISISAPDSGKILAEVSGYIEILHGQNPDHVGLNILKNENDEVFTHGVSCVYLPDSLPKSTYQFPFSCRRAFNTESGPTVLYLVARHALGSNRGSTWIYYPVMKVVFYTTTY